MIIIVIHSGKQFKYEINSNVDEWDNDTYLHLINSIKKAFDLNGTFSLYELMHGDIIDIDDMDDIKDAFETESDNEGSNGQSEQYKNTLYLYVKMTAKNNDEKEKRQTGVNGDDIILSIQNKTKSIKNEEDKEQYDNDTNKQFDVQKPIEPNTEIKKINKSSVFLNHCKGNNVKDCVSIQRIKSILKFYGNHDNNYEELTEELEDFPHFISDYHHILEKHLNEEGSKNNANQQFKLIYNEMVNNNNLSCNVNKCKIYLRNNRDRTTELIKCDQNTAILIDLLDTIHSYFIHSVDIGYRLINDPQNISTNDTNNISYDSQMVNLKLYLSTKRKNLEEIRGINRLQNNKFMTQLSSNEGNLNNDEEETKDSNRADEQKQDDDANDKEMAKYCFGHRLDYWRSSKHKAKYESMKAELLSNTIHCIDKKMYLRAYQKAKYLLNHSYNIKQMKSFLNSATYGIKPDSKIKISNILSIILYTDFDTLSYNFSATWREIKDNESAKSIKKRNREYWHWSKKLIVTVNCYGTRMHYSEVEVFYHGVSRVYFDSFIAQFNSPTSTTIKLQIAAVFAKNDGLILELKAFRFSNATYFNCSFISCFANEDERLFIAPPLDHQDCLEINAIRDLSTNENYNTFIKALITLEGFINGNAPKQKIPDWESEIICNLFSYSILKINDHNYPNYILRSFEKWAKKKQEINGLKTLTKLCPLLLNANNLVRFDEIGLIFPEVTSLYCRDTGIVDDAYLQSLVGILNNIPKDAKLRELCLRDVKNIKSYHDRYYKPKMLNTKEAWEICRYSRVNSKLWITRNFLKKSKYQKKKKKKKTKNVVVRNDADNSDQNAQTDDSNSSGF